ncbi:MAG TPA: hypothetical protein VM802_07690 [Chitinophaga sp.]|uniref:hypothetical protein n=1 Tax=Chitinophaga sp. TaxID=1869181 RepID=UPI002CD9B3CB|nr:hypothetical protein [Chitinophaga sp.]HVI44735.1 hypothetical protein [Chitinophaga sp.]
MSNSNYYTKIDGIRRQWMRRQLYSCLLLSAAAAFTGSIFGIWGALAGFVVALPLLLIFVYPWKLENGEIARYLDQTFPELEDSTSLLLRNPESAPQLERMQVQKVAAALETVVLPPRFYRPLRRALLIASVSLLAGIAGHFLVKRHYLPDHIAFTSSAIKKEKILPGIRQVNIFIQPPAYTGKSRRSQSSFNITAEDSSRLHWELHTNTAVSSLSLIFNDSTQLPLKPEKDSTVWTAGRLVQKSGFYQVMLNGELSDLYQLQLLPDQPPVVHISAPKPYTVIEFGQSARINIQASATDDYGISDAFITATIASGSGEAVRFKEQQLRFGSSFQGHLPAYQLSRQINLTEMGMKPGDELYFHIAVTDTRHQQTRSDVYIITLPDTAQLFSLDGMVNGVNFKPEYFRSQRQIIIDAEQLLKEKDSLSKEKFNTRSNDLGTDQKLLRLRYGKFLGEESETNIGDPRAAGDHDDHDHDHHDHHGKEHTENDPKDFGNAEKILDGFTHKHDNAEDATFFDPAIKQQLKATLTEMWKSELQLRLYKPQEALPFAYKALRLLKDLQQQSRSYVAKTGAKTTPLKPEKRLTGELDKISPAMKKEQVTVKDETAIVRIALSVLESWKDNHQSNGADTLAAAMQVLSQQAATAPAAYLPALEALRRIRQRHFTIKDITLAQKGLRRILSAPSQNPQRSADIPGSDLQRRYFRNLKTGHTP